MKDIKSRICLSSIFIVSTFLANVVQGSSLKIGGQPLASVDKRNLVEDEKFFENKLKRTSLPVPEKRDSELAKQSGENIKTWDRLER